MKKYKALFKFLIQEINILSFELRKKKQYINFNKTTQNIINSYEVDLNSIVGRHIEIGKGTYISQDSVIDSYTYIGFNSLISKTKIGRYNSIASNVNIGHGEHPIEFISTNTIFINNPYATLTNKECIIENDVWIGIGAIIRRGVTVGTGSIIGANSFVNKDVPPYSIVVGSPARLLKYRFSEKKIKILLESKWWEFDSKEAQRIINDLEIKIVE